MASLQLDIFNPEKDEWNSWGHRFKEWFLLSPSVHFLKERMPRQLRWRSEQLTHMWVQTIVLPLCTTSKESTWKRISINSMVWKTSSSLTSQGLFLQTRKDTVSLRICFTMTTCSDVWLKPNSVSWQSMWYICDGSLQWTSVATAKVIRGHIPGHTYMYHWSCWARIAQVN